MQAVIEPDTFGYCQGCQEKSPVGELWLVREGSDHPRHKLLGKLCEGCLKALETMLREVL